MPPINDCIARLEVAPVGMKTWDDVALWFHELAEPQIKAGNGVKSKALELTARVDNNNEKLKNIYEWVRDQVRYVAVEIGVGGFQPHPAEEIFLNRYGDCKDMTTLICSLAREAGIEAYEVLVSTWHNGVPDTSLPSPLQFNHAIAYCPEVGENGTWMDATEKGCPYGRLPWYDQGLPMLVVGNEGKGAIIFSPRVPADSNQAILDWNVHLDKNGSASVAGKSVHRGTVADEMRDLFYYLSSAQQRDWLETYLATRCAGAKLDSFKIFDVKSVMDPFMMHYSFQASAFAIPQNSQMIIRPGQILKFELPDYFRATHRKHPIQFRFGSKTALNLTVHIPDQWEINNPNASDSLVSQFGKAKWDYSAHEKILTARIMSFLNGSDVQPGQYREFQDFIDRIKANHFMEIVLQPTK